MSEDELRPDIGHFQRDLEAIRTNILNAQGRKATTDSWSRDDEDDLQLHLEYEQMLLRIIRERRGAFEQERRELEITLESLSGRILKLQARVGLTDDPSAEDQRDLNELLAEERLAKSALAKHLTPAQRAEYERSEGIGEHAGMTYEGQVAASELAVGRESPPDSRPETTPQRRSNRLIMVGGAVAFVTIVVVAATTLGGGGGGSEDAASQTQTSVNQAQTSVNQAQTSVNQAQTNANQTQNDAGTPEVGPASDDVGASSAAGPIASGTFEGRHWIKWQLGEQVADQVEYHTTYQLNIRSDADGLWGAGHTFPLNEAAFATAFCLEDRPDCGNGGEVQVEGELSSERDAIIFWLPAGTFGDATGLKIYAVKQTYVDPNAAPATEAVADGAVIPLETEELPPPPC